MHRTRPLLRRAFSTSPSPAPASSARVLALAAGAAATSYALYTLHRPEVHNDAPRAQDGVSISVETGRAERAALGISPAPAKTEPGLEVYVWGSNKNATLDPNPSDAIRTPQPHARLSGHALRDLVLAERYGAAVDARGDVFLWGAGYDPASPDRLERTLAGKDITTLASSPTKLYALSRSGQIFVLPSTHTPASSLTPRTSSWLPFTSPAPPTSDYDVLTPHTPLARNERFTSISSGSSHLLALTSAGRAFAHPINSRANAQGQLGVKRVVLDSPGEVPLPIADPLARTTLGARPAAAEESEAERRLREGEKDIRWCTRLFEIPSLKGVELAQLAAGERASYALTPAGRVLGWGANEYGQLGLGATATLPLIPIPTEILLSKSYPAGTSLRVTRIHAGGNSVYFTVRAVDGRTRREREDLWAAGHGQWGAMGNGQFVQAQGAPVRVRSVSGLLEYSEQTKSLVPLPLHALSASPTGHVLLTLSTDILSPPSPSNAFGKDLFVFGLNSSSELGNGKRSSLSTPQHIGPLAPPPPALGLLAAAPGGQVAEAKVRSGTTSPMPHARCQLRGGTVREVRDLEGKRAGSNVRVQETAVAGHAASGVYWKIVE